MLVAQQPVQQPPPQAATPQQPPPPLTNPPPRSGPVVVLDPSHGGTDTGARGAGGIVEKDVVLMFARIARGELERLGFRVVMTRNGDSNPSYDERAAIANAYRDAIFISFHVSSTGTIGTARAYSYQFSTPLETPAPSHGLIVWEEAQQPYLAASHRLADLLQVELSPRFAASPLASAAVAVRELRSVATPAVAVEISSVSVVDPITLTQMAAPLATSIGRGVLAFRPAESAGTK
ncbi:MAG: N-acetylmuramoyl-L-alanine amidase [Candidatus Acidiferrales bacterium]